MIILNSDYELPFVFFDKLDKIEPLKMDDGTYTKRCFYYRDKDKRVLVRINKDTIKNIELVSNDSKTNIHSYTNSGAGSAILGGLIAGDEGFATGALLGRETKIYSTYESRYTVLITFKNDKAMLVECDDQEKNELFFLKSKLTDKEVEVEETKIFSEIEKDFWKLIDKRNKMHRKINCTVSYASAFTFIEVVRLIFGGCFAVFFAMFLAFLGQDRPKDILISLLLSIIFLFCFCFSIFGVSSNSYPTKKLIKIKYDDLSIEKTEQINNYFGLELYFTKLLHNEQIRRDKRWR